MKQLILIAALSASLLAAERTKQIDRHVPAPVGKKIELRGFKATEIEFKSWSKPEVYINIRVTYASSNEEEEQEYVEKIDIVQKQSSDGLIMELVVPVHRNKFSFRDLFNFGSYSRASITGEIWIPELNSLYLEIPYGSAEIDHRSGPLAIDGKSSTLKLRDCAAVSKINNDYGTTEIEQCGGSLELEGKSSTVTVNGFKGPVNIQAEYSNVKLRDISKDAEVMTKSGTLSAERIGGDLTVEADYSHVSALDIAGRVDVRDQSGSIRVRNAAGFSADAPYSEVDISSVTDKKGNGIRIKGKSGKLTLESITGNLLIDNPYSRMDLRGIKGSVELRTTSGTLTGEGITGNFTANVEYSHIDIDGLTADTIRVSNKSDGVNLILKNVPTRLDVRNQYGSIRVEMPRGFTGDVRMKVSYGSIDTNLPVTVEEIGNGAGAYVSERIGNGKGSMNLETTSAGLKVTVR